MYSDLIHSMGKQTKEGKQRCHICDFRRCRLNVRLCAHIQPLLPGHKYGIAVSLPSVFGWIWVELNVDNRLDFSKV